MDMMNSIAAASVNMHSTQLQQDVQLSVMKKTMDTQEQQMETLVNEMLPPSNNLLDVLA